MSIAASDGAFVLHPGGTMLKYLSVLALAAVASSSVTRDASAGACGGPATVELVQPCPPVESYLVNQGPVLSGPGHYLGQLEEARPCCDVYRYPYVGFVYSGYPYGALGPGGYPRGSYSPYTGYPYAEPYPYLGRRAHRSVRRQVGHNVARNVARAHSAYYRR
jgi:hypothetical protein